MMIVICSFKGSPGATTLAVALGTHWPDSARPIVVEADPAGGDVAARFRLPSSPGLSNLAAAARGSSDANLLAQHAHVLASGLRVIAAPVDPVQSQAALAALSPPPWSTVREPVLMDVGRVDPDPAMLRVLRSADALIVVARPHDESLAHVAARREQVQAWSRRPGLVLVGKGYPATQVSEALGLQVFANLPHDVKGADGLWHQRGFGSPLERHAAALAAQFVQGSMPIPAVLPQPALQGGVR